MDLQEKDFFIIIFIIYFLYRTFNVREKMENNYNLEDNIKKIYSNTMKDVQIITKITNELTSTGKIKIDGDLTLEGPINYLPKGSIVAWFQEEAPYGWVFCNGSKGTPDLRGRFIYGYGKDLGSVIGRTGGEETHKLTINEIPAHKHSISLNKSGSHNHYVKENYAIGANSLYGVSGKSATRCGNCWKNKSGIDSGNANSAPSINGTTTTKNGSHGHTLSLLQNGNNIPHNNMPPFYTINWIMKI